MPISRSWSRPTTNGSSSAPASASATSSSAGVATSDMAKEASLGAIRAGRDHAGRHRLHRRRHDHARHDLPEHRLRAAGQDRRDPLLGLRSRRRLFRLHLCADRRHADGRDRRARSRAGGRRRHDVEHHRLSRSHHLHPVRRRRRRGGAVARPAEDEPAIIDFAHEIDGSGGPALCMPAGGSRHAGVARDRRQPPCTT